MQRTKMKWLLGLGMGLIVLTLAPVSGALAQGGKSKTTTAKSAAKESAPAGPVDINSATEKQLEDLPGVGPSTAKKIVGGRPYASVNDLAKAGISKATITKITPLVTVGGAGAAAASIPTPTPSKRAAARDSAAEKASAPTGPVDINNATEKQLVDLPGVGPATAKKIISGRPYASVNDLTKAGVSKATITKITPLVSVGAASAVALPNPTPAVRRTAAAAPVAAPPAVAPATSPSAPAAAAEAPAAYTPPPAQGMVWVNLPTKVYHKAGDRWYGKTKNGKYMTEADAIQAGYRLAK